MTEGLEVFVQEVIAAITTLTRGRRSVSVPSSSVTRTGLEALVPSPDATGSEAGKVPARPLSRLASST